MFATSSSRPTLRHSSSSNSGDGGCTRLCDRLAARFCDLRTFVFVIGGIILLANIVLLVQLNPSSGVAEQRPNGGPVEGPDHGIVTLAIPQIDVSEERTTITETTPTPTTTEDAAAAALSPVARQAKLRRAQQVSRDAAMKEQVKRAAEKQQRETELLQRQQQQHQSPQPQQTQPSINSPLTPSSSSSSTDIWRRPGVEHCDRHFGNGFVPSLSYCAQTGPNKPREPSALDCTYNSLTKGATCEARNIMIDLRKLQVSHGGEPIESVRGRSEDAEFIRYLDGAITLACTPPPDGPPKPTPELLPHHLSLMTKSIVYEGPTLDLTPEATLNQRCEAWIEEPTLFVTRYEYANLYHSMGDFYNSYQTKKMYGLDDDDTTSSSSEPQQRVRVVFFDGHSAGALDEIWTVMYGEGQVTYVKGLPALFGESPRASGGGGIGMHRFCFRRAFFVSPAYKSALSIDMMTQERTCTTRHPCLDDFARDLIERYQIDQLNPWQDIFPADDPTSRDIFGRPILPTKDEADLTKTPLVTMIFRRDYLAHPRLQTLKAQRKIANEDALGESLARINEGEGSINFVAAPGQKVHAIGVDFAVLNIRQQLFLIRSSTILVGIHGAGLSYALFLPKGSSLIEITPPEYQARVHFNYFAQWSGIKYDTLIAGSDGGQGHLVTVSMFESKINRFVLETNGGKPCQPTAGWMKGDGGSSPLLQDPIERIADGPESTPSNEEDAVPDFDTSTLVFPTEGMTLDPLPASDNPHELDASHDRGEDFPTSLYTDENKHRLCIVIPFRDSPSPTSQGGNRTGNLMELIPHLIKHLTTGGMTFVRDFEIIVVEQTPGYVFNKGALFNAGYIYARQAACDYMVLHDVDQIPLSPKNRYIFPEGAHHPIHLCSASSQYGYAQAYGTMVGGALLITMSQYEQVNGYSNFYWGWGQEDDDFYFRLANKFGDVRRLNSQEGRYLALSHPRIQDLDVTPIFTRGSKHLAETRIGTFDIFTDGITNLKQTVRAVEHWNEWPRGVRKIVTELQFSQMPKDLK